jgi:hypothetical protein
MRRAGILSIACDGNSAVLAPAEPDASDDKDVEQPEPDEPTNPWENGANYPTGNVPSFGDIDESLPEIPQFGET